MSIKNNFIKGAKWTTIGQIATAVIATLKLSVLARLLEPEAFGLLALAMLIQGFTAIFADLGLSVSLFHKQEIEKSIYSTLYWINIIMNVSLYLILMAIMPLIVWYFNEPELYTVIPLLGLNLIFIALGKHYGIYAEKDMKFKAITIINTGISIFVFGVSIILAIQGYGVYSLILPLLCEGLIRSLSYFTLMSKKYPLSLSFKFKETKDFFNVGLYQSSAQVLDFFAQHLDILIIEKLLGLEILGIYNLLKQFAERIYSLINSIVTKVAIPIFSSFNHDESLLKSRYLTIVNQVSFLNAVMYAGLAFVAEEVIHILYGVNFIEFHQAFSMMCFLFLLNSTASLAGILVVSKGKTKYGMYWTMYRVLFSTLFIIILGYYFGIYGILTGLLLFSFKGVYMYWRIVIVKVQTNLSFGEHLTSFMPNIIMAVILFISSFISYQLLSWSFSLTLSTILKSIIFLFWFSLYLTVFRVEEIKSYLMPLFKNYVARVKN